MKSNKRYITIALVILVVVIVVGVLLKACTNIPAVTSTGSQDNQLYTQSSNSTQNMLLGTAAGYVAGTAINSANNRSRDTKTRTVPLKSRPLPKTTPKPKTIVKTTPTVTPKSLSKPVSIKKPKVRKPSVTKRKNKVSSRSKSRSRR